MSSSRSLSLSSPLVVALIVALVVALAATGYALYQEKKEPSGVEISIGKSGIKVEGK